MSKVADKSSSSSRKTARRSSRAIKMSLRVPVLYNEGVYKQTGKSRRGRS